MTTTTEDTATATPADLYDIRQLRRSTDDRMLAGVAGGIARYLNVDVTLVRIAVAALTLLTGAGAVLYVAAWLFIPAYDEDQSIAGAWIADRKNRVR